MYFSDWKFEARVPTWPCDGVGLLWVCRPVLTCHRDSELTLWPLQMSTLNPSQGSITLMTKWFSKGSPSHSISGPRVSLCEFWRDTNTQFLWFFGSDLDSFPAHLRWVSAGRWSSSLDDVPPSLWSGTLVTFRTLNYSQHRRTVLDKFSLLETVVIKEFHQKDLLNYDCKQNNFEGTKCPHDKEPYVSSRLPSNLSADTFKLEPRRNYYILSHPNPELPSLLLKRLLCSQTRKPVLNASSSPKVTSVS